MTRGRMLLAGGACAVLITLAGAGAWAKNGVVTTRDGQRYEGEVVEKGGDVVVTVKGGIPVTIRKDNLDAIEYADNTEAQFKQRLAKLDKKDSAAHVELARWAVDRREYMLALDALDGAIAADPNNEDALQLRSLIYKQRRVQTAAHARNAAANAATAEPVPTAQTAAAAQRGAAPPAQPGGRGRTNPGQGQQGQPPMDAPAADAPPGDTGAQGTRRAAVRREPRKPRLVTPAEINRIRQLELGKGERVQVRFQNDVKQRFLSSSEFTPQEFNRMQPLEQGMEILRSGGTKLHPDVVIASDPASIAVYKRDVERNILPGCATSACHGSTKAGPFVLHSPANNEAHTYTNFLYLQQYPLSTEGDKAAPRPTISVGGKDYAVVDRARPENSLLLLYGLPQKDSDAPHPEAQNFRPLFRGKNDPKYQALLNWVSRTLAPVPPEYGIDLSKEPEEGNATTRPARGGGGREAMDRGGADAGAGGGRDTRP